MQQLTQTLRQSAQRLQPATRRKPDHQTAQAQRPPELAADGILNGFLRYSFTALPAHPAGPYADRRQADFFASLRFLCDYFDLPDYYSPHGYPTNVYEQLHRVRAALADRHPGYDVDIIEGAVNPDGYALTACLRVTHTALYTQKMYYLPLMPLSELECDSSMKAIYELALSVYSYLLTKAELNYPSGENYSYIAGAYDRMEEYHKEEVEHYQSQINEWEKKLEKVEEAEKKEIKTQIEESQDEIEEIEYKIHQIEEGTHEAAALKILLNEPVHLEKFKERIAAVTPTTDEQTEFLTAAKGIYDLYQRYPDRSLLTSIEPIRYNEDGEIDDDSEHISLDCYVSFIFSETDGTSDEIINDFNQSLYANATSMDEPKATICFDHAGAQYPVDINYDVELYGHLATLCQTMTVLTL